MNDKKLFLISAIDNENSASLRNSTRQYHLDYISGNNHKVAMAGPYINYDGISVGSMYIIYASNEEDAEHFIRNDPYYKENLFKEVQIRRWRLVIDNIHA